MEELTFPTFDYYLDQSDPDVLILRRQDGSFVAAFSARGATKEGILEAAKEDCRKWLRLRAVDYIMRDRSGGKLMSSR
jgi:hypothetical protein